MKKILLIAALAFTVSFGALAATPVVITSGDMQGWEKSIPDAGYTNAETKFKLDDSALSGSGVLFMKANLDTDYSMWTKVSNSSVKAIDVNVFYSSKRLSGPEHAAPSYVLTLDKDGDSTTLDDYFYALYEPAYNSGSDIDYNSWNTWNITSASNFWYSGGPVEAVNYTPLNNLLEYYPDTTVVETTLNIGTGNGGWAFYVDNVSTVDGVIYDFEFSKMPVCSVVNEVKISNLSNWDFSDTRATGHYELTTDGLHIWTEGTASTDKAAGYYPVDFALKDLGTNSIADTMTYVASSSPKLPGSQLVIDFNNDGTPDGILVGEIIYGNDWWLSNSAAQFAKDGAPNVGGGYGSSYYGTAEEWMNAFPQAKVKAIGYSLGSGVLGDGVVKSMTYGCTTYTFSLAPSVSNAVFVAKSDHLIVDFKVSGFTDNANSIKISLYDAEGNLITENVGDSADMVALLNTNPEEISSPFWIPAQEDDGYWVFGNPDWKNVNKPSYAAITLVYDGDVEVVSENIPFVSPDESGNNWEDLIAALPETPVTPPTPGNSGGGGGGGIIWNPGIGPWVSGIANQGSNAGGLGQQVSDVATTRPTPGRVLGATAFQFTQNMKLGSTGTEVKALQKFLNAKGFKLSDVGAGSIGNETSYFGPRTKAALIKYQEANNAILTRVEITNNKGTGNFFFSTRDFVNEYLLTDSEISAQLEN